MVTVREITKISQVTPEVTLFLRSLDFSNYYIIKIFDLLGEGTIGLIEDDPYCLLDEFPKMGFKRVDQVASMLGVEPTHEKRISAAVKYVLGAYVSEGHSYAPMDEFSLKVGDFLQVDSRLIRDVLEDMAFLGKIQIANINGIQGIYFYGYYRAECTVAGMLAELEDPRRGLPPMTGDLDFHIGKFESENNIILSEAQKLAVKNAFNGGVSIITGGPGTGKTTIINAIISIFEASGHKVAVAAPTGRAAKRIMETSGRFASTIHRLLEYSYNEETRYMSFGKNADSPLDLDGIIIDEASMMDLMLTEGLVRALKPGTRLIFVGDADQLPSVGAGNVLDDLIESEYFHVSKLTEIYRQSMESNIVMNAHRINRGRALEFGGDFLLVRGSKHEEILKRIVAEASKYPLSEVQVITPTKKGIVGSVNLNQELQKIFNPPAEGKGQIKFGEKIFSIGDRVMQIKNNYQLEYTCFTDTKMAVASDPMVSFTKEQRESGEAIRTGKGVFNGEIGTVVAVDSDFRTLTVLYDEERWVEYAYDKLEEIELAYAVTVHKSQGSEFPVVIIPATWFPEALATRSLIYTAITRGKNKVIVVGRPDYLEAMVQNNRSRSRYSGLKERLVGLYQSV